MTCDKQLSIREDTYESVNPIDIGLQSIKPFRSPLILLLCLSIPVLRCKDCQILVLWCRGSRVQDWGQDDWCGFFPDVARGRLNHTWTRVQLVGSRVGLGITPHRPHILEIGLLLHYIIKVTNVQSQNI